MKKMKVKAWVLPCMYCLIAVGTIGSITFMGLNLNQSSNMFDEYVDIDSNYVIDVVEPNDVVVNSEVTNKTVIPYKHEKVTIQTDYYSKSDEAEIQEKSLIFYNNTYIQSTGIHYTSEEEFIIYAAYDGTVENITQDEILGTVLEIKHNEDYTTYYYSIESLEVKVGDIVKTGQTIAMSGKSILENTTDNNLIFEVYYKANAIDPTDFYDIQINN